MTRIPIGCASGAPKTYYDVSEEDVVNALAIIRMLINLPEGQTWEVQRDEQGQIKKRLDTWAVVISTEGAVVLVSGMTAKHGKRGNPPLERNIIFHFPIVKEPTMGSRHSSDYAYFGSDPKFILHSETVKSKMFEHDYDFLLQVTEHMTGNPADSRSRHLEPLRLLADNYLPHRTRGRVSRSLLSIITLNTCTLLFSIYIFSFVLLVHPPKWKCTCQCTSWILGSP